jgi:hypothetical protein
MKKVLLTLLLFFHAYMRIASAQLTVDTSGNYNWLVNDFAGTGVVVSNISYTGAFNSAGYFSNGVATGLPAESGILLTTGIANEAEFTESYFASSDMTSAGNLLLNAIAAYPTSDASVLEFDVMPAGDTLSFEYFFASEDYPENVSSSYADVIGFFISGVNPAGGSYLNTNFAFVPSTSQPVSVTTINATTNSQYYVSNTSGPPVYDGHTKLLTATIPVAPSSNYRLTIAIGDVGDHIYDSGIFLKSASLKSDTAVGIGEISSRPHFRLLGNPLSFNSALVYTMHAAEEVDISLSDITGRCVRTFVRERLPQGEHKLSLYNEDLRKGVYMLRAVIGDRQTVFKLMK